MHSEKVDAQDLAGVTLIRGGNADEQVNITGSYEVKCLDAEGNLKWEDTIKNLVVTVGKNDLLDKYFKGSAYTAGWYMGLVDNASFHDYSAADTLASHAGNGTTTGWLEFLSYSVSGGSTTNRAAPTWNTAGTPTAGSLSTQATTFTITASGNVQGALMCTTLAKGTATDGGAGILYSAGSFTGGSRAVASGDSLLVTYTASV
jgi:hypothetical protein